MKNAVVKLRGMLMIPVVCYGCGTHNAPIDSSSPNEAGKEISSEISENDDDVFFNFTVVHEAPWHVEVWTDCLALVTGDAINVGMRICYEGGPLPKNVSPRLVLVLTKLENKQRKIVCECAPVFRKVYRAPSNRVLISDGRRDVEMKLHEGMGLEARIDDAFYTDRRRGEEVRILDRGIYELEIELMIEKSITLQVPKMPIDIEEHVR
jgi:hypothetical protein